MSSQRNLSRCMLIVLIIIVILKWLEWSTSNFLSKFLLFFKRFCIFKTTFEFCWWLPFVLWKLFEVDHLYWILCFIIQIECVDPQQSFPSIYNFMGVWKSLSKLIDLGSWIWAYRLRINVFIGSFIWWLFLITFFIVVLLFLDD